MSEPPATDAFVSRHRQQIAVAVITAENRVLIGRRPAGVPLAGFWEFPGGKVELGEAPVATARRECAEEAGLHVQFVRELPPVTHNYAHGELQLQFFHGHEQGPPQRPRPPFDWVPIDELDRYVFPPANQSVLAWLRDQAESLAGPGE